MELNDMTLEQVIEKLAELDKEVREAQDLETVEKAKESKAELLERKKELEELEARKQTALDLQAGIVQGTVIETKPIIKEERTMENLQNVASVEYRNAYLNNLRGMATPEERAAITAATVIPTITLNKIVEKLEQTSVLYNKITVLNIPGNVSIPVENAKNDASWVAMATASNDSADSFAAVTLGAFKLIKTIEITADVMSMSIDAFESFVVAALAKKMSKAVENAILNGAGTTQPTGLLKAGEITATETWTAAGMTYDDLMKIIAKLPTSYHPNATFVTNRDVFFKVIHGMKDEQKRPIVKQEQEGGARYTIFGYPVVLNDYVGANTLLFGDLEYFYWNWARPVSIDRDDSVGFRTGSSVYRGMALADGKKALAEAFVVAKKAE